MLKNYFLIAWRNISKSPFYAIVNTAGLSIGIAFAFIVAAFIWGELDVNSHIKNADRQYIIQSKWKDPNLGIDITSLGEMAKALKENYPSLVANYYRWDGVTSTVSNGDKHFREGLQICDSTMLEMYGFPLLYGNAAKAFSEPFNVVITEDKAIKYFGKTDVIGQSLTIESFSGSRHDFVVSGVLKKLSKNSTTFLNDENDNQVFISSANISFFGRNMSWNNQYVVNYIQLQPGVSSGALQRPMEQLVKLNAPQLASNLTPYLVSLKDYHLQANNGLVQKMLYALSAIALFIIAMAIINFINMAVSRSGSRMREIGIRKVMGGLRNQLMMQFLTESVVLVFLSTLLALLIYIFTKDIFGVLLSTTIPSLTAFPLYYIFIPVLLTLLIGLAAGIYPAFVLSSLRSVESLKGKLVSVKENVLLRKSLVGFQFGIAAIAFTGAIIISKQIDLFFSKDLGYNKDYILVTQLPRDWSPAGVQKMEALRKQFAELPQVSNVSLSYEVLNGNSGGGAALFKQGSDSSTATSSQLLISDEYFGATYNIPMAAGQFFGPPGAISDSFNLVINETQSKALGWKDPAEAIGKKLLFQNGGQAFTVAGVTKDFHFGSMQSAIPAVTFIKVAVVNSFRVFSFKLKPGNLASSVEAVQKKWAALLPNAPFDYSFMDDALKKLYKSEIRLKQASFVATILAVVIVLLGVLGLVSLNVQKRTKEIGIRKVLGSSVPGIISLFIKEFLVVVLIAAVAACPLAYLLMHQWLQGYAYQVKIGPAPFITALLLLGFATAITILIQTFRAAVENPVKSLRSE